MRTILASYSAKRNLTNFRAVSRSKEYSSLSVFKEGNGFRFLDGERRWRCALKIGLSSVPVIVQPKPARLQNLMMMFAIHHERREWDHLPTALKLEELEKS